LVLTKQAQIILHCMIPKALISNIILH